MSLDDFSTYDHFDDGEEQGRKEARKGRRKEKGEAQPKAKPKPGGPTQVRKSSIDDFEIYDPFNDGEEQGRKEARRGKWNEKGKGKPKSRPKSEEQDETPGSQMQNQCTIPEKSEPQEQQPTLENFKTFDPFADVEEEERQEFVKAQAKAHAKAKARGQDTEGPVEGEKRKEFVKTKAKAQAKAKDKAQGNEGPEEEQPTSPIVYEKHTETLIHIRVQQRNKKKALTTIQGLPQWFDQEKILRVLKRQSHCNGNVVEDPGMGAVIQLQGDQRKDVMGFLVGKEGLDLEERVVRVHGF